MAAKMGQRNKRIEQGGEDKIIALNPTISTSTNIKCPKTHQWKARDCQVRITTRRPNYRLLTRNLL